MEIPVDKPIVIAVILFIALILVFYMVMPQYNEFRGLLIKVGEKTAERDSKAAYYANITDTYYKLQQYSEGLKKLDTALPQTFNVSELLNLLYKKSVDSGIAIQNISISSPGNVPDMKIKMTNVVLGLVGDYPSLDDFLTSLEISARLIEGENISFASIIPSAANPKGEGAFPIQVIVKVFSY